MTPAIASDTPLVSTLPPWAFAVADGVTEMGRVHIYGGHVDLDFEAPRLPFAVD